MTVINPLPGFPFGDRYGPRGFVPGVGNVGDHTGLDIPAPAGTPIYAAVTGLVLRVWWDAFVGGAGAGGNMVAIRGDNGIETRYAHMQAQSPLRPGQRVTAGQTVVGYVGMTGAANGNHLHFETLVNGRFVNPETYLTGATAPSPSKGNEMIRIQSPGRGIALVGPGYYRHLLNDEEVVNSGPLISSHRSGNDREFDLYVSMCLSGTAAKTGEKSQATVNINDSAIKQIVSQIQKNLTLNISGTAKGA